MTTTDASPKLLILSAGFLVLSLLLISATAVAAFVPLLHCSNHPQEQSEELDPCLECNGYGRSTLFQRWSRLRYDRQQEPFQVRM